ncbi:MAG: YncE family protein [Bryobacterales bacterium]|nr:YncE family protein [Bryobacterales bacterium]
MRFLILSLGLLPFLVAQGPALVVVEKKASAVAFYSSDGKRLSDAKVGKTPHEIVYSPDRRLLYVSNNGILWMTETGAGGNTISIIDVASRKQNGVIDLGPNHRPHGMDVDPKTGNILVTVENPYGLLLVDPKARKVIRRYDTKGQKPHMVLLDKDARFAYVSNSGSGDAGVLNLATGAVRNIPVGRNPQGAVRSKDGTRIYLTVEIDKSIAVLDTAKQALIGKIKTGDGPGRVALTPDEKTLVYNLQAGAGMGFADVASLKQTAEIRLPGKPLSMNLSKDGGKAYLGLQDSDKIAVVSIPQRKILRIIDTPKDSGPDPVIELP